MKFLPLSLNDGQTEGKYYCLTEYASTGKRRLFEE
jgi:hypothetical protein